LYTVGRQREKQRKRRKFKLKQENMKQGLDRRLEGHIARNCLKNKTKQKKETLQRRGGDKGELEVWDQ
jgi:hypothetical protein